MAKKKSENYLDLIPRHSDKISYEKTDDGQVTLLIENKGVFNRLMQKIAKKPRITRVDAEGQGSFVWLCIDGERTVFDIALALKDEFGDDAEPVCERLLTYLHTLEGCGIVEMTKQKSPRLR